MEKARAEQTMEITGFRRVFEGASFHQQHKAFLDNREEKDLEATLAELESQIKAGTMHPSYLYNALIQEQRMRNSFGCVPMLGAGIFAGIGGSAGYAIAETVIGHPVAAGVVAAISFFVTGGVAMHTIDSILNHNRRISDEKKARVCHELTERWRVGTSDQLYPPKQEDERVSTYRISYERETEGNVSSSRPIVFREEHRLVDEESSVSLKVIVENGIPKRMLLDKKWHSIQYWDLSRTGRGMFPSPLEVPLDALDVYQKRVQKYIVFE